MKHPKVFEEQKYCNKKMNEIRNIDKKISLCNLSLKSRILKGTNTNSHNRNIYNKNGSSSRRKEFKELIESYVEALAFHETLFVSHYILGDLLLLNRIQKDHNPPNRFQLK